MHGDATGPGQTLCNPPKSSTVSSLFSAGGNVSGCTLKNAILQTKHGGEASFIIDNAPKPEQLGGQCPRSGSRTGAPTGCDVGRRNHLECEMQNVEYTHLSQAPSNSGARTTLRSGPGHPKGLEALLHREQRRPGKMICRSLVLLDLTVSGCGRCRIIAAQYIVI